MSRITIPEGAAGCILRQSMGIPEKAVWIAYSIPMMESTQGIARNGGFVFFDEGKEFLEEFLVVVGQEVGEDVHIFEFSAPVEKAEGDIPKSLLSETRWADITIPVLLENGARRYAWVCDYELPEAKNMGGFLYALENATFIFFPVRVPMQ